MQVTCSHKGIPKLLIHKLNALDHIFPSIQTLKESELVMFFWKPPYLPPMLI